MTSSSRCHGPGCTRTAVVEFWCSESCQEKWDRQLAGVPAPVSETRLRETSAAARQADLDRHAWLLANAPHPILCALIEAHGPHGDDRWPDCAACPAPPSEFNGNPEPESWPCSVWSFVSDRMEEGT